MKFEIVSVFWSSDDTEWKFIYTLMASDPLNRVQQTDPLLKITFKYTHETCMGKENIAKC